MRKKCMTNWIRASDLHTKGNHCAKYESPPATMVKRAYTTIHKTDFNMFDLDLWLQSHIGDLKPSFIF